MNKNIDKIKLKIVLVEDEVRIAVGLEKILKSRLKGIMDKANLEFIHALTLEEFKRIEQASETINIIDLNLEGPNEEKEGLEVLKILKLSNNSFFKPIVYTATDNRGAREIAEKFGVDVNHFISKRLVSQDVSKIVELIQEDFNTYLLNQKEKNVLDSPPVSSKKLTIPSFNRDDLAGEDQLNFTPDIEAIAMLIASKKTIPPLSIGVFADWGSGKSFFMEKLRDQIDILSESKFITSSSDTPFVERVLSINFNAWHYLDTDLWSSIFCKIIQELIRALKIKTGDEADIQELLEDLDVYKIAIADLEVKKNDLLKECRHFEEVIRNKSDRKERASLEEKLQEYQLEISLTSHHIDRIKRGFDLAEYLPVLFKNYDERLGLIASIRKDLENLSHKFLHHQGFKQKEVSIDRIILFIDDLDRCPPEKVVIVLQAIHLILAFELFVVVVGVDIRWVSEAIEKEYPHLNPRIKKVESKWNMKKPPSSLDYLEKIFQIPYSLRPMNKGSAVTLLNSLLTGDIEEEKESNTAMTSTLEPVVEEKMNSALNSGRALADNVLLIRSQKLRISDSEQAFLKSMAPFLMKSPRAIKRFVNTYRLLKVHSNGPATQEENEITLFLLAILIGSPDLAAFIFPKLNDPVNQQKEFRSIIQLMEDTIKDGKTEFSKRSFEALIGNSEIKPLLELPIHGFQKKMNLVKSFSFRATF